MHSPQINYTNIGIKKLIQISCHLSLAITSIGCSIFLASRIFWAISSFNFSVPIPPLPFFQFLIFLSYIYSVYIFRGSKNWISYGSLLLVLGVYFFSLSNLNPLGDHDLLIADSKQSFISLAEPLAYFLQKFLVKHLGNSSYLNFVPPLFGILTVIFYFILCDLLSKILYVSKSTFKLALIALPLPFFYTYGYIENPQLSTPFLLLFIIASVYYLNPRKLGDGLLSWSCLCLCLSLAILMHGQNWFLMPTLFLIPFLKKGSISLGKYIVEILLGILIFLVAAYALYKVSSMEGWVFFSGSSGGGGDGQRFVPIHESDLNRYATFTMFSLKHSLQSAKIIVLGGVYTLSIPLILVLRHQLKVSLNRLDEFFSIPVVTLLGILSLAYLSFIFLWNFDLGFPVDLDLMLTMGVPFSLFNVIIIDRLIPNYFAKTALFSISGLMMLWHFSQLQMVR